MAYSSLPRMARTTRGLGKMTICGAMGVSSLIVPIMKGKLPTELLMGMAPTKMGKKCTVGSGETTSAMGREKRPSKAEGIGIVGTSLTIVTTGREPCKTKIIHLLEILRKVSMMEKGGFSGKMERPSWVYLGQGKRCMEDMCYPTGVTTRACMRVGFRVEGESSGGVTECGMWGCGEEASSREKEWK